MIEPNRCGVWVPACAGTTIFVLHICTSNEFPVRLSGWRLPIQPQRIMRQRADGKSAETGAPRIPFVYKRARIGRCHLLRRIAPSLKVDAHDRLLHCPFLGAVRR